MPETVRKLVLTQPGGQVQEFVLSFGGATLGRGTVNDIVLDMKTAASCEF